MGIHSVNSLDHKLINFNVPKYLITNFDNLMRFKRISRTSMLIRLMEEYVRSEKKNMEEDNTLNLMINDITKRNKDDLKKELVGLRKEVREEYEPPMVPQFDDHQNDGWSEETNSGWLSWRR